MRKGWAWPLRDPHAGGVLQAGGPGAFGAIRKHDIHTGVDIHCPEGSEVTAVEPGKVVAILPFTGAQAESSWWLDTKCVMVEGVSGVVCYGEIEPDLTLAVGVSVPKGHLLGKVLRVLKNDKGVPTSMLHVELYGVGARTPVWWKLHDPQPALLVDPTPYLLGCLP